jgi:16S rRNA (cytosine967-C5)-methyltransferase
VPPISARRVALAALRTWRNSKAFADSIVAKLLSNTPLPSADRAFVIELFYGVLRNLTLLDLWIDALRPSRVEADVRDALRLGLYQLFIARIPEHAAVYETVALVPKRRRAILNGILRSAIRRTAELDNAAKSEPLYVRFSHPEFVVERWERQFGKDATQALCEWNNQPPPIYTRINRLRIDRQAFLEHYPDARLLTTSADFVELPSPTEALNQGDCYVQDPSTAIACELLQPKPGERILDACAAPGGKTGYLAELMENQGLIVACDRESQRLARLDTNLARLGVKISKIVRQDWRQRKISGTVRSEAPFDRILIDAPCSNTGVMRRRVDVRWRLRPSDFLRMQAWQIEIVKAVAPLLKPDGILVYSTCSLEREENDAVTQAILRDAPGLRLDEERRCQPFADRFDGAFAAKLRRKA